MRGGGVYKSRVNIIFMYIKVFRMWLKMAQVFMDPPLPPWDLVDVPAPAGSVEDRDRPLCLPNLLKLSDYKPGARLSNLLGPTKHGLNMFLQLGWIETC